MTAAGGGQGQEEGGGGALGELTPSPFGFGKTC